MEKMTDKVWYIACAYSTGIPEGADKSQTLNYRNHEVQRISAELIKQGHILLEPIASCHYKYGKFNLPAGYSYWKKRDRKFLDLSDGMVVITLNEEHWKNSVGVTDEINYCRAQGKPIYLLHGLQKGEFRLEKI